MEELVLTPKDKQDARLALLRHYSSECVAHGAYLVAIAVGFFGLTEVTPFILEFAAGVALLPLAPDVVRSVILSLIVSGFIVLIVHVLSRTFFWGHLATAILNVKPKKEDGVECEPERTTVTFLQQLHVACFDYVREKHGWSAAFYKLRLRHLALIWFDLFVVFFIVSLILLHVH